MLYAVVLYLHVLAALTLASAFAIETLSLFRMRRAKSLSEARPWVNLIGRLPVTVGISGLVLLFSGGYLTAKMAAWGLAWPRVAVGALLLIAPFGAISGKRIRAIRRMLLNDPNGRSIAEALSDRFLTLSLNLRLWILAGILWLMTAKPAITASLLAIGICVVLGCLCAALGSRRRANLTVLDAPACSRS